MTVHKLAFTVITLAALLASSALAQQHEMPAGMTCQQHQAQMKREVEMKMHGNVAMGFDQDKTSHHFLMTRDGGAIQVETNDDADSTSRDQIRSHLKAISEQFANGDFSAPYATHMETIPGITCGHQLQLRRKSARCLGQDQVHQPKGDRRRASIPPIPN